jgi:hypothetical protein
LGLIIWIAFCLGAPLAFQDQRLRASYVDAERLQALCHRNHGDPDAPGLTPERRALVLAKHDRCDKHMSLVHYISGHFMEYETAVMKLAAVSALLVLGAYGVYVISNYRRPKRWHDPENRPHAQPAKTATAAPRPPPPPELESRHSPAAAKALKVHAAAGADAFTRHPAARW